MQRDPNNGAAAWALALLIPDTPRNWAEKEAYLRNVSDRDMDFPYVVVSLVQLARQEGRLEEAANLQRRVVMLDPFSPYRAAALAWILASEDRVAEAQGLLERASENWPGANAVRVHRLNMAVWHESPDVATQVLQSSAAALGVKASKLACLQAFIHAREHVTPKVVNAIREVCRGLRHTDLLTRMLAYLDDIDGAYETIKDVDISTHGTYFLYYPEMRRFRRDPRFMILARRLAFVARL